MSKQILILSNGYPPQTGGIETYSEQVAIAYASLGHHVTVLTQFPGEIGESTRDGIVIHNVGPGTQPRVALRLYRKLRSIKRRQKFDFVHATTWRLSLPVIANRLSCPIYVTVHGREVAMQTGLVAKLMNWAFRRVTRAFFVSGTTAELSYPHVPHLKKIGTVSWNGLSYPNEAEATPSGRSSVSDDSPLTVTTICRLVQRKNIASAIKACAILRDDPEVPPFRYLIAGKGPDADALKKTATELNADNFVSFLGYVPNEDVAKLYRTADVFLHPQAHSHDPRDFEGFCLSVADAMSFGCPTIAGEDGAPREFIKNGETAILVKGTPEDVAAALKDLLLDPAKRDRISRKAQAWAIANLSWRKHIEKILEFEDSRIERVKQAR